MFDTEKHIYPKVRASMLSQECRFHRLANFFYLGMRSTMPAAIVLCRFYASMMDNREISWL